MATRRSFLRQGIVAGALGVPGGRGGVVARGGTMGKANPAAGDGQINIGIIIFSRMDQIDFTGPFEVLSRVPDATVHVLAKEKGPIRDIKGLILTPEMTFDEAPALDVLVVPGGPGQQDLMEDEAVLSFIRDRAARARYVYSVCTGALICGAAGLLTGVRSTTHWASFDLLKYFGAIPVDERGSTARSGSRRSSGATRPPRRSSSASSTPPSRPSRAALRAPHRPTSSTRQKPPCGRSPKSGSKPPGGSPRNWACGCRRNDRAKHA